MPVFEIDFDVFKELSAALRSPNATAKTDVSRSMLRMPSITTSGVGRRRWSVLLSDRNVRHNRGRVSISAGTEFRARAIKGERRFRSAAI